MRRLFCPFLLDPDRLIEPEDDAEPLSKQVNSTYSLSCVCLGDDD